MCRATCYFLLALMLLASFCVSKVDANTETRYFRNDEALGTSQTTSSDGVLVYDTEVITTLYYGVRVWKSNGTLTEITSGSSVAIASSNAGGTFSASWSCPQTSLEINDYIIVKVYADDFSPPTTLAQTFTSEALGASSLDSASWTVYYAVTRTKAGGWYSYTFKYGFSTYNSRITNFVYSLPSARSWHYVSWTFDLTTRQWNYQYRVFDLVTRQWSFQYWYFELGGRVWSFQVWTFELGKGGFNIALWLGIAVMGLLFGFGYVQVKKARKKGD